MSQTSAKSEDKRKRLWEKWDYNIVFQIARACYLRQGSGRENERSCYPTDFLLKLKSMMGRWTGLPKERRVRKQKLKKASKSLLMKKQHTLPRYGCSVPLQVLLVRKQCWRITGRLWEGIKCVEKAIQRVKKSPESVIKDKERKRVDELASWVWCISVWIALCVFGVMYIAGLRAFLGYP